MSDKPSKFWEQKVWFLLLKNELSYDATRTGCPVSRGKHHTVYLFHPTAFYSLPSHIKGGLCLVLLQVSSLDSFIHALSHFRLSLTHGLAHLAYSLSLTDSKLLEAGFSSAPGVTLPLCLPPGGESSLHPLRALIPLHWSLWVRF